MKNRTFRAKALPVNYNKRLGDKPITVEIHNGVTIDLDYHGWPSIHRGKDGVLYAVSSIRTEHISPFGAIGLTKSYDGGETWTPYRIIVDTPLDDRDCGIVDLGEGHLMVWWFTHDAFKYLDGGIYSGWRRNPARTPEQLAAIDEKYAKLDEEAACGGSYVAHSLDGGETWGDPIRVPVTCPHGPTLMNDGKTLIVAGYSWYSYKVMNPPLPGKQVHLLTSTDGGYTWSMLNSIPFPARIFGDASEFHVLQLRSGTILVAYRDSGLGENRGHLKTSVARSEDGGKTWSEFERVPTATGGPPHLCQLADGKVLLTYGCRTAPACGERCVISEDDGLTWSNEMVLSVANRPFDIDLGYPSSAQADDGSIVTVYYQKFGEEPNCSFLYTKWELIEEGTIEI